MTLMLALIGLFILIGLFQPSVTPRVYIRSGIVVGVVALLFLFTLDY